MGFCKLFGVMVVCCVNFVAQRRLQTVSDVAWQHPPYQKFTHQVLHELRVLLAPVSPPHPALGLRGAHALMPVFRPRPPAANGGRGADHMPFLLRSPSWLWVGWPALCGGRPTLCHAGGPFTRAMPPFPAASTPMPSLPPPPLDAGSAPRGPGAGCFPSPPSPSGSASASSCRPAPLACWWALSPAVQPGTWPGSHGWVSTTQPLRSVGRQVNPPHR